MDGSQRHTSTMKRTGSRGERPCGGPGRRVGTHPITTFPNSARSRTTHIRGSSQMWLRRVNRLDRGIGNWANAWTQSHDHVTYHRVANAPSTTTGRQRRRNSASSMCVEFFFN